MDLHYSQTPSRRKAPKRWFYYLMDLHYSQTLFRQLPTTIMFYYLMDLHYSQTTHYKLYKVLGFTTLWIYTILKLIIGRRRSRTPFYYLMDLHYSQTQGILQALLIRFTTLWIYTILKPLSDLRAAVGVLLPYGFTLFSNKIPRSSTFQKFYYLMDLHYSQTPPLSIAITTSFTTLWIYTILKPQISCAHYTAQGKSTRSSTIVLWRNGIVKGAQIPIQHIEFGAHIYAHRRLAL